MFLLTREVYHSAALWRDAISESAMLCGLAVIGLGGPKAPGRYTKQIANIVSFFYLWDQYIIYLTQCVYKIRFMRRASDLSYFSS